MNSALWKTGHPSQLYGVEESRLVGGKADGMRLLTMRNGKGITLTLQPDRCLDPSRLEYKGVNLSFFSPCGYAAPAYYDQENFLRTFPAGLMTTCGLQNVGAPCEDEGQACVTHGRISHTPCENLQYDADYTRDDGAVTAAGRMRQAVIFGEKLELYRRVTLAQDNTVTFHDVVTNMGGERQPLMVLYHINMGHPLLDEGLELMVPALATRGRDPRADEGLAEWRQFPAPQAGFAEQCYYHDIARQGDWRGVAVFNPRLGLGLRIDYSAETLDYFTQWKMCGVNDYVLGLEPGNCHVEGRAKMRADGRLRYLEPGESAAFTVRFTVFEAAAADAVRRDLMGRIE